MENTQPRSCGTCGPWWRLPLLLGLVLAAIVWSRSSALRESSPENSTDQPGSTADANAREKVELVIDFGGGRRKNFEAIAWHDGMTVADLLHAASGLAITQKGSPVLLTSIDGVENQGAAAENWTYTVNGQMADRSFAEYELKPGDQVLWTFGPRQ